MTDLSARTPAHDTTLADIAASGFLARYRGETVTLYAGDLRIFYTWCREQGVNPLQAKRYHLEEFRRHLEDDRGNSPRSVRRRLQTLRSFFKLAHADELIERDPTLMLRMPAVHRDIDRLVWLDRYQVGAMLRHAQRRSPDHHALIGLMSLGGLRVSAACTARLEDLHQERGGKWYLDVTEKGRRMHHARVSAPLLEIIENARDGRTEGPIVRRRNGREQDRNGAYAWVRLIAEDAGLGKVNPHSLRRAAIRTIIDGGASMQDARDFAGHAHTSTTELYHPTGGAHGVDGADMAAAAFAAVA